MYIQGNYFWTKKRITIFHLHDGRFQARLGTSIYRTTSKMDEIGGETISFIDNKTIIIRDKKLQTDSRVIIGDILL